MRELHRGAESTGGVGVHVEHLAREVSRAVNRQVSVQEAKQALQQLAIESHIYPVDQDEMSWMPV